VLSEIKNLKQERGPGRRRWFESDGLEVVVWYGSDERVTGFQLCYDFGRGDHALTWRPGGGFAHSTIDTGDESPLVNRTPILEPDGEVPWTKLAEVFDACSSTLEPGLQELIRDKLAESGGRKPESR
jgi:hypothetical protein